MQFLKLWLLVSLYRTCMFSLKYMNIYSELFRFGLSSSEAWQQALKNVETKLLKLYLRFLSMKIENSNVEMFSVWSFLSVSGAVYIIFNFFLKKIVYFSHACWKTIGLKNSSYLTGETLKNSRMTSLDAVSCKGNKSSFRSPTRCFALGFRLHCVYFSSSQLSFRSSTCRQVYVVRWTLSNQPISSVRDRYQIW